MSNCLTEAHFKVFYDEHKSFQNQQSDFLQKITKKLMEQTDLNEKLAISLTRAEERISVLEDRIDHLEATFTLPKTTKLPTNIYKNVSFTQKCEKLPSKVIERIPDDPCEILVSGISSSITQSPAELVNRLLLFVGLSSAINYVFATRTWKPKHQKPGPATRAFVVKFSSPQIRNEVLRKMRFLKNYDSQGIFGASDRSIINVIDLLPKRTHLLLLKARKLYEMLDYAPPIVKNSLVYMRKSSHSPLIPIFSENDLNNLSTKTKP